MTFEFYVTLGKVHSEIILFNSTMLFSSLPFFCCLFSHYFKILDPSGIYFAMRVR